MLAGSLPAVVVYSRACALSRLATWFVDGCRRRCDCVRVFVLTWPMLVYFRAMCSCHVFVSCVRVNVCAGECAGVWLFIWPNVLCFGHKTVTVTVTLAPRHIAALHRTTLLHCTPPLHYTALHLTTAPHCTALHRRLWNERRRSESRQPPSKRLTVRTGS
jgi:hypothetical protein